MTQMLDTSVEKGDTFVLQEEIRATCPYGGELSPEPVVIPAGSRLTTFLVVDQEIGQFVFLGEQDGSHLYPPILKEDLLRSRFTYCGKQDFAA